MSESTNGLNGPATANDLVPSTDDCTSDFDVSADELVADKAAAAVAAATAATAADASSPCEMCSNYEMQLQQLQEVERTLRAELQVAQCAADRHRTDLSAERLARAELEAKVTGASAHVHNTLTQAEDRLEELSSHLTTMESSYSSQLDALNEALKSQMDQRVQLEEEMKALAEHYRRLLGTHRRSASAMRAEPIELPQSVDALQEMCLRLREELIETRAGREHEHAAFTSELHMLRQQLSHTLESGGKRESVLADEITELRTKLAVGQSHESAALCAAQKLEEKERRLAESQGTIDDLETKLTSVQGDKGEIEFALKTAQKQVKILQHELSTSETVQKDFVKLSQSLQIELEKIRQAEQEVRWQWAEDVRSCSGCSKSLQSVGDEQKRHCRHCGRIFCDKCLGHTVPSGPSGRPAHVCTICHTLLCRDAAPYFSDSAADANKKVSPKQKT